MKTAVNVLIVTALTTTSVSALAQSQGQGGQVTNSTSTVRMTSSQLTTLSGQGTASLLARGVIGSIGGGDLTIGGLRACNGGKIDNVHTDVRMQGVTITSAGKTSIGEVSAGCSQ